MPQPRTPPETFHTPQAPGARSARSCAPRAWTRDATRFAHRAPAHVAVRRAVARCGQAARPLKPLARLAVTVHAGSIVAARPQLTGERLRTAAMSTALYVILENRGIVSVDGPEAGPFLQGLISNDIERVTDAHCIYAALLTPQGKFLHDFFVLRRGSGLPAGLRGAAHGRPRAQTHGLQAACRRGARRRDRGLPGRSRSSAIDGRRERIRACRQATAARSAPAQGGMAPARPARRCARAPRRSYPADADLAFLERAGFAPRQPRRLRVPPHRERARPTAAATWRWAGRR